MCLLFKNISSFVLVNKFTKFPSERFMGSEFTWGANWKKLSIDYCPSLICKNPEFDGHTNLTLAPVSRQFKKRSRSRLLVLDVFDVLDVLDKLLLIGSNNKCGFVRLGIAILAAGGVCWSPQQAIGPLFLHTFALTRQEQQVPNNSINWLHQQSVWAGYGLGYLLERWGGGVK